MSDPGSRGKVICSTHINCCSFSCLRLLLGTHMQLIFVVPEIGFLLVAAPFLIISHKGPLYMALLPGRWGPNIYWFYQPYSPMTDNSCGSLFDIPRAPNLSFYLPFDQVSDSLANQWPSSAVAVAYRAAQIVHKLTRGIYGKRVQTASKHGLELAHS